MLVPEDPPAAVPEWIVTYGDMMSLLLTFFIMLASMSEIKEPDRFQGVADSLRQQFGQDSAPWSAVPGWARPRNQHDEATRKAGSQGTQGGAAAKGDFPKVTIVRPGTQTAVGTVIFFDESAVELSPQNKTALLATAPHLGGKPQKIEVRGHSSPRAGGSSDGADNWDLAYRRCRSTMRFLVEEMQLDPRRVRMSVAGPNEPLRFDSTLDRQRHNPRVEVFLLDELASESGAAPESLPLEPSATNPTAP